MESPSATLTLPVCLPAKNAAIKRCAFSKCGIEFATPKKGGKAKFCCVKCRRECQNQRRRAAIVQRRNQHFARLNRDRTQMFDSRTSGYTVPGVGPYRSPQRERLERREYERLIVRHNDAIRVIDGEVVR